MTSQNLNLNETLNIVEKELSTLSVPYIWSLAHYQLKRELLLSFINTKSFFNVTFVIKRFSSRKAKVTRRGNKKKARRIYPLVKILLTSTVKELFKHPFFRLLNLRKKFSLKALKPHIGFRTDEWIINNQDRSNLISTSEMKRRPTYEEQFSELNKLLSGPSYLEKFKNTSRTKMKNLRRKFKKASDRLILKRPMSHTSSFNNKINNKSNLSSNKVVKVIKINGQLKNFTEEECKINGKNNIWTRLTGAHYLVLYPNLILKTKLTRDNFTHLAQSVKSVKVTRKRTIPNRIRYTPKSTRTLAKFKEYVDKKYNFLDMVYEVLGETDQVERLKREREEHRKNSTWPYNKSITTNVVVEEEVPVPFLERISSGNFFQKTKIIETIKTITLAEVPLRYLRFPSLLKKKLTSKPNDISDRQTVYLKFFWFKKPVDTPFNKGVFLVHPLDNKKNKVIKK